MRIAHVTTSDISVRFLLVNQLIAFQRAGLDVVAVCGEGEWVKDIRKHDLEVHTVPMRREISVVEDFRTVRALVKLFRQEKFSVVHSHTPKAGLLAPLAARIAKIPHVVHTVHGLLFHDRMPLLRQVPFMIAETLTARFAEHLLFQSREDMSVAARLRLASPARIHYQGNGIDIKRFDPTLIQSQCREALRKEWGFPPDAYVVGMVGRLVKEKGFEEFLVAANTLIARSSKIRFVVIGPRETDQKDALDLNLDSNKQLGSRMCWIGMRFDMPALYSAMDLFVLPSHREGIPRALMEASAMGLPVVASDIRGCREVVAHGKTGLLVPMKDPSALVSAIESLMNSESEARSMGEAGTKRISTQFDEDLVISRQVEFYRRILNETSHGKVSRDSKRSHC